jgi:hypothetical protein
MEYTRQPVAGALIWRAGLAAALWSAAINGMIFIMGVLSDVMPSLGFLPNTAAEPSLASVIAVSALGALGGAALYRFLAARTENPFHFFAVVAGVVLVLSLMIPFSALGWNPDVIFLLTVMHVITASLTAAYMRGTARTLATG